MSFVQHFVKHTYFIFCLNVIIIISVVLLLLLLLSVHIVRQFSTCGFARSQSQSQSLFIVAGVGALIRTVFFFISLEFKLLVLLRTIIIYYLFSIRLHIFLPIDLPLSHIIGILFSSRPDTNRKQVHLFQ